MQTQAITNTDILEQAPSIGAVTPFHEVSGKYSFLSTIQVVDLLRDQGWFPTKVEEMQTRNEKIGFQKHMVRFQHRDLVIGSNEAVEKE
ncbi:MAG: hypothetical protein KAJ90_00420 [Desulfobacterales bacterium]|nr:hypothetical protein [Desulfobacterales bacterium]